MKSIFILLVLFALTILPAQAEDLNKILKEVDRLYRSDSSYSQIEMRVETPDWKRTLDMEIWTQGMKKTFIKILSPKKDAGIATLKKDNEMWNYFPKIDKVIKVPASMMMGSWMGSDFTNDDLVKESTLLDDYVGKIVPNSDGQHYYIELKPKAQTVSVWGKIELKLQKNNLMPVSEIYYNERGEKARVLNFKDVRLVDGRKIPMIMELIPMNKTGNKTVVEYKKVNFNQKIDSSIFSRNNLQKRR